MRNLTTWFEGFLMYITIWQAPKQCELSNNSIVIYAAVYAYKSLTIPKNTILGIV